MATVLIQNLTAATTPLTGAELIPLVQGGITKQTAMTNALAQPYYAKTTAENTAGVTPTNYAYTPYDLPRYGALLDNSTDDGTAVRNWLLASIQAGAEATCSVGGTALCTTFTAIDTTSAVRINAPGLTLKGPAGATDFCRPGGDVYCRNVIFERWASLFERERAETGSITDFIVESCEWSNISSLVINIERPITDYRINQNKSTNTNGGYVIRIGENVYAEQDDWVKGELIGNHFTDINGTGAASTAAALIYGREVTIANNYVQDVDGDSGEGWGFYTKVRHGAIYGNIIRDVQSASSSDVVGINIKGNGRGLTSAPQGYNIRCFGNHVENIGVAGTKGTCIRAQSDDISVYGNICEDGGIHGVTVDETGGSSNIQVHGNKIRFAVTTAKVGIYFATGGSKYLITDNVVTGASTGVRIASAAALAAADLTCSGNILEATTAAVDINTPDGFNGLRIVNNTLVAGARGVLNSVGAGTITKLEILDNEFARATTAVLGGTFPVGTHIRQAHKVSTTDGSTTSGVIVTLADESAWLCTSRVVAKQSDASNRNAYGKYALIYRDAAGSATIQGAVADMFTDIESAAAWSSTIAITGNSVRQTLIGAAATNVDWDCLFEVQGV